MSQIVVVMSPGDGRAAPRGLPAVPYSPERGWGEQVVGRDVVVLGEAGLLARVATALWRDTPSVPRRFAMVGDDLHAFESLAAALKAMRSTRPRSLTWPTVRVMASTDLDPRLAFQVGFGALARLVAARQQRGYVLGTAALLADAGAADDDVTFHLDRGAAQDAAYLQVCARPDGWFRMAAGSKPTWRSGSAAPELLRDLPKAPLRRLQRAIGMGVNEFTVIHVTGHSGYVVDDDVFGESVSQTVEVRPGPNLTLLVG